MRVTGAVAIVLIVAGCAGRVFTNDVNATPTIAEAQRLIAEAQQAGADSLAAVPLLAARQALSSAQGFAGRGEAGSAHLAALRAQAEARYAAAVAVRTLAERAHSRARTALDALPPEGGPR